MLERRTDIGTVIIKTLREMDDPMATGLPGSVLRYSVSGAGTRGHRCAGKETE
ncbi:MAG: hypothetical protein LUQ32_06680 [Methanomicrobiales archaeon]|nr:hypothetical protein [Methanomicrobiales archaeon]